MNIYGYTVENEYGSYYAVQYQLMHKDSLSVNQLAIYNRLRFTSEYIFVHVDGIRAATLKEVKKLAGFALPYSHWSITECNEWRMWTDLTDKEIKQVIYREL